MVPIIVLYHFLSEFWPLYQSPIHNICLPKHPISQVIDWFILVAVFNWPMAELQSEIFWTPHPSFFYCWTIWSLFQWSNFMGNFVCRKSTSICIVQMIMYMGTRVLKCMWLTFRILFTKLKKYFAKYGFKGTRLQIYNLLWKFWKFLSFVLN